MEALKSLKEVIKSTREGGRGTTRKGLPSFQKFSL